MSDLKLKCIYYYLTVFLYLLLPTLHAEDNTLETNKIPLPALLQLMTIERADHQVLAMPAYTVIFPLGPEIKKFITHMKTFFLDLESPYGSPAGLAAPQVGAPVQIIFYQILPKAKENRKDVFDIVPPTMLINPSYTPVGEEGMALDWEGCFSVPDMMGEVSRYYAIHYEGYDINGEKITGTAKGLLARILQHEIDHVQGKLYTSLLDDNSHYGHIEEMFTLQQEALKHDATKH